MSPIKRKIIFASRLDDDCSLGAYTLCAIAPALARKYEDLEIMIIGGGTEYAKIKSCAQKINKNINLRLIILTGKVPNTADFLTKDALFVGVSRAALEAMAKGLAVILLGNEGYLGLLDAKKLPQAITTNFTCRASYAKNIKSALFHDICHYFEMSEAQHHELSSLSRKVVTDAYSAEKMTNDTLNVYRETIERYKRENPLKIAVCGYYERGNFGDETILKVILDCIKNQNLYATARVITPKNLLLCLKNLYRADLFVFGGGSLLQNATSNFSLIFYLSIISVANLLCRRKIMLSNGIGPIVSRDKVHMLLTNALSFAVNTFDLISVRDSISQNKLKVLLPNRKIFLLPDPALIEFSQRIQSLKNSHNHLCDKDYFVFCPHARALENNNITAQVLAKTLEHLSKKYSAHPVIAVLNKTDDLSLAEMLQRNIKCACATIFTNQNDMASVFSGAKFVISQRYHGTLLAISCNTPTLSLSQDPKMYGLSRDFNIAAPITPKILANPTLTDEILKKALNYHKNHSSEIQSQTEILTKKAEKISSVLKL